MNGMNNGGMGGLPARQPPPGAPMAGNGGLAATPGQGVGAAVSTAMTPNRLPMRPDQQEAMYQSNKARLAMEKSGQAMSGGGGQFMQTQPMMRGPARMPAGSSVGDALQGFQTQMGQAMGPENDYRQAPRQDSRLGMHMGADPRVRAGFLNAVQMGHGTDFMAAHPRFANRFQGAMDRGGQAAASGRTFEMLNQREGGGATLMPEPSMGRPMAPRPMRPAARAASSRMSRGR